MFLFADDQSRCKKIGIRGHWTNRLLSITKSSEWDWCLQRASK